MKPDPPLETASGSVRPRRCPVCGVPFPVHGDEAGCPVCQLRQALQPESTMEGDLDAEVCFHHYRLVRGEDGAIVELGHGTMGVTYKAFGEAGG
jgi:hypothetical protein